MDCKKHIYEEKKAVGIVAGRKREPTSVVIAKGKKHLTKKEIEERQAQELDVPFKDVQAPKYLTAAQKKEFDSIAEKLCALEIFTELDCDLLAQYIIAKTLYLKYSEQIKKIVDKANAVHKWSAIDEIAEDVEDAEDLKNLLEKILRRQRGDDLTVIMNLQDKAFKQCIACARELGLTVTSRLKLAIPEVTDDDDEL